MSNEKMRVHESIKVTLSDTAKEAFKKWLRIAAELDDKHVEELEMHTYYSRHKLIHHLFTSSM